MKIDFRLHRIVAAQPYPLLFATISGAHLYGFPSPDSDFDLRGAHVLPLEKIAGLEVSDETIEQEMLVPPVAEPLRESKFSPDNPHPAAPPSPAPAGEGQGGEGRVLEMDIVSHDVRKFFGLLLKKNGYVLEQLFSPLIVRTTPEHEELKGICNPREFEGNLENAGKAGTEAGAPGKKASGVITRHHAHHYFGFAETQWKLFLKESPRRVKPLLYVYRVLLTGIWLMRTGRIEANLVTLNESFKLPYLPELIARKLAGPEKSTLKDADIAFHEAEYERLRGELQAAHESSTLPEVPDEGTRRALNDLLVRVRMKGIGYRLALTPAQWLPKPATS